MLTSNQSPSQTPVASDAPLSAIGRVDTATSTPVTSLGEMPPLSPQSSWLNKIKMKYVLGGLLFALIAIGSGVGFWLSSQQQDVRQQASVDDDLYGTVCVGQNPVRCACGVCGTSQADCNAKCGTGTPSNPPTPAKSCPAGSSLLSGSTTICSCALSAGTGSKSFSIDSPLPSECQAGTGATCNPATTCCEKNGCVVWVPESAL